MTRGRLVVHGHFYQPLRVDPFTGLVPREPSASPFHDWNERIDAECYRPNVQRGNLARISFDVGPTLAAWLEAADPSTYKGFIRADRPAIDLVGEPASPSGAVFHGNAIAQAFHHVILPLASLIDRRTEVRWGIRDFQLRFGRAPEGMWLPETAVDLPTLRILAEEGIRYTILAPWQCADPSLDVHRLYQVALGGGRAMIVAFYDAALSGAVSFDPAATADADTFIRDRLLPAFAAHPRPIHPGGVDMGSGPGGGSGARGSAAAAREHDGSLVVIATDGELYGHHQKFRDLFLHRLVAPDDAAGSAWTAAGPAAAGATSAAGSTAGVAPRTDSPGADRGFDLVTLAAVVAEQDPASMPQTRIVERTSWSCHHGVARWSAECPDAADGRWKGPLRAALERLAAGMDASATDLVRREAEAFDLWAARDAYVDVVVASDADATAAFTGRWLSKIRSTIVRERMLQLLEAQRWRLAMFASDAWFWDDPIRPETMQVLRAAARATQIVDQLAGTDLEERFLDDLTLLTSPSRGIDGAAIYREALAGIGRAPD